MSDQHYTNPRLAALYDLGCGWSVDREFYLSLAGEVPQKILDLGCGTGLICHALAKKGHCVTGVDPSPEMLRIARNQINGDKITWVKSTAQDLNPDGQFDLVIMTGHAFQVLLTEGDVLLAFENIKNSLSDQGQFVFESRNPDFDWAACWDYRLELKTPQGSVRETRQLMDFKDGIMHFDLTYHFKGDSLVSNSVLRFWQKSEIEKLLISSGLKSTQCLGGWNGDRFEKDSSDEMIFFTRAKPSEMIL